MTSNNYIEQLKKVKETYLYLNVNGLKCYLWTDNSEQLNPVFSIFNKFKLTPIEEITVVRKDYVSAGHDIVEDVLVANEVSSTNAIPPESEIKGYSDLLNLSDDVAQQITDKLNDVDKIDRGKIIPHLKVLWFEVYLNLVQSYEVDSEQFNSVYNEFLLKFNWLVHKLRYGFSPNNVHQQYLSELKESKYLPTYFKSNIDAILFYQSEKKPILEDIGYLLVRFIQLRKAIGRKANLKPIKVSDSENRKRGPKPKISDETLRNDLKLLLAEGGFEADENEEKDYHNYKIAEYLIHNDEKYNTYKDPRRLSDKVKAIVEGKEFKEDLQNYKKQLKEKGTDKD